MSKTTFSTTGHTQFDLGFEHGAEADEDPSDLEFQSRVPAYQLGFIVGRSFSEAVKQANYLAVAATAGRLGARYGVDINDLLQALEVSVHHDQTIRQAYVQSTAH
ncbi:hypothetical protein [Cupriavidus necator]